MAKGKLIGLSVFAALLVAAGAYVMFSSPGQPIAQTVESQEENTAAPAEDESVAAVAESMPVADVIPVSAGDIVTDALAPRTLGDPDAPVKIEEFASLTCSHCANFSKETFGKLKEHYIDTGKVYFTYSDYPLNAPALDAAIIARCLPQERYFKFIKFLFDTQEKWAFGGAYLQSLKQNAKLLGATEDTLDACLDNEDIRQGLVKRMQDAAENHEIKATPSFVINGKETLRGGHSFEDMKKLIDELLKES